jgi:hypothetical protein
MDVLVVTYYIPEPYGVQVHSTRIVGGEELGRKFTVHSHF